MTSTLRHNAAFTARTRPTTGDTKTSFINDDHMGWIKCDGRALDTKQFNLLFQVIGYTFGGSGSSFNLPNAQGRVMGSVGTVTDDASRTRSYTPGQSVGELDHRLTLPEIPSHNHGGNTGDSLTGITHNASGPSPGGGGTGNGQGLIIQDGNNTQNGSVNGGNEPNLYASSVALVLTDPQHHHSIASAGGDGYHNNIQPTLFYGNTFIYSSVPQYGSFPFTTGRNPVII